MSSDLLTRRVERRPGSVQLRGRVLYLADDPALVASQLAGTDLDWTPSVKLRDNISTDEITPAYICYYFDETLGEFPYLGFKAGDKFPITRGSVKQGGFVASVAGKRRGKGSSREQSPYAEMCAGIQLVVGESIEQVIERTTRLAMLGEWNHLALLHGEPKYLTAQELEVYNADQRFPMRGWEYYVSRLNEKK